MLPSVHRKIGRRLLRAGLPPVYVQRVVDELREHAIDKEHRHYEDSGRCLGVESDTLADQFVTSYRSAKWFRRLPAFCWILFPIPLCIVSHLVSHAITIAPLLVLVNFFDKPWLSAGEAMLVEGVFYATKLIGPVIAAWLLVHAQYKAAVSYRTKVAGFFVLAIMFFFTMSDLVLYAAAGARSLTLSFDMDREMSLGLLAWQLAQVAIVLAVLMVEVIRWTWRTSGEWLANAS